jgi:uncharacterized protein involved in outer membrane biogenesis
MLLLGAIEIASPAIELNDARSGINRYINSITARHVKIDGDIQLIVSLNPRLTISRIHIKNLDSFDNEDFIIVNKAIVEIPVLPLLQGELHLTDTEVESITLNLHKKTDGSYNWSFDHLRNKDVTESNIQLKDGQEKKVIDRFSLGEFRLLNVTINYRDDLHKHVFSKQVNELLIDATDKQNPEARISGHFGEHDYDFQLNSTATEMLVSGQPWQLTGKGKIAGSSVNIKSELQSHDDAFDIELITSITDIDIGKLLSELDIISGLDIFNEHAAFTATLHGSDMMELYQSARIRLQLGKGYWNPHDPDHNNKSTLAISQASAVVSWDSPVIIDFDGNYKDEAIDIRLTTNHLKDFFDDISELDIDLFMSIADTEISANGNLTLPINKRKFLLDIDIKGKDLERLNPIINTEFPPLNDFRVSGNLRFSDKNIILKSATASVGETKLLSSIVIDREPETSLWNINLKAENLQINDFIFDDWTHQSSAPSSESRKEKPATDTSAAESKQPLDQIINRKVKEFENKLKDPRMHLNMNLSVDNLLIGSNRLGKGRLQFHMLDNVFAIRNADIEVPGGRIQTSLSLRKPQQEFVGDLKLDIDKLDYGVIAKMLDPEAKLSGAISTRIDLELRGDSISQAFDHANGIIDIAFWPRNTQPARILNLWTTNLYLILLPELKKKESKVNCLVGLMNVENGIMKEELLAIDTTKLWINGNITVNFERQHVDLSLFPASKTARFFAIQTPIRVEGSYTDISLALNPVDLTTSYISFITSPLHVPARWIFEDKPPLDGSAICEQYFDRDYVTKVNAELREKEKRSIDELLESD